jgi:integrase
MIKKLFKWGRPVHWTILDKEVVDEIIFRTANPRDRLMLELMARGGMRISEVLKLTPKDVEDRRLLLREPKSGKEVEVVFIPKKVAERLSNYIRHRQVGPDERIFPIAYPTAWSIVHRAGKIVAIHLRPHDLRRHAATYASRSGTPIEIVSKVILRHSNLATTQQYLGKVSDAEAMRWIDNLHS